MGRVIEAFQCECGALFPLGSDRYVSLVGALYIGESGGILGSQPKEGEPLPRVRMCLDCFHEFVDGIPDIIAEHNRLSPPSLIG